MKVCTKCGELLALSEFSPAKQCRDGHRGGCKRCHNRDEKARDKAHRRSITTEYKREERFRRVYGITLACYERMLVEQKGVCAICGHIQSWNRREGDVLVVDHDHDSGRVRGLLCHACNQTLGLMRDDPQTLRRAAAYLEVKQDEAAGSDDTGEV